MKKVLTMLLTLVFITGLLVGCGQGRVDTDKNENTSNISSYTSSTDTSSKEEISSTDAVTSEESTSSKDEVSSKDAVSSEEATSSKDQTSSKNETSGKDEVSGQDAVSSEEATSSNNVSSNNVSSNNVSSNNVSSNHTSSDSTSSSTTNPTTIKKDTEYLGNFVVSGSGLVATYIQFDEEYAVFGERYFTAIHPESNQAASITYNGTRYHSEGAGFNGSEYKIKDNLIEVYFPNKKNEVMIKLAVMQDGSIKILESDPENAAFVKGKTLKTGKIFSE
ncbi:MAG: hypothetical protein IKV36_05500 [Clostridia bacterium]|nr:hypothetical protein [Clostridia bacterium]